MLKVKNKMNSNKHEHKYPKELEEATKRPVSSWWIVGVCLGVFLVAGIMYMAFSLVEESQDLTAFQTFVVAVMGLLITGVTGVFAKYSYDKKQTQEFWKFQIQKTLEHEETIEKIRLQTNGRLHRRNDLILFQDEYIALLEAVKAKGEDGDPAEVDELKARIKQMKIVLRDLKPLYPREDS